MHCPTHSGLLHDAFCTVQVAGGQEGHTSTTLILRIPQVECPVQNVTTNLFLHQTHKRIYRREFINIVERIVGIVQNLI